MSKAEHLFFSGHVSAGMCVCVSHVLLNSRESEGQLEPFFFKSHLLSLGWPTDDLQAALCPVLGEGFGCVQMFGHPCYDEKLQRKDDPIPQKMQHE